jgi:outer membrane protein assembly factor BamC
LALDRVGFTVEDRDRSKGLYFVRYVDDEAMTNNEGFFTRLFGSSDKDANAKRYQILVKGNGNVSYVSVQNNHGETEKSSAANKMLSLLQEQLK